MTRHNPAHEVELFRDADAYVVYADLPNYTIEEVDIRWHDQRLHLSADSHDGDGRATVFHRQVSLPHSIDDDGITAEFEDGVLEVTLPIESEARRPGQEIRID